MRAFEHVIGLVADHPDTGVAELRYRIRQMVPPPDRAPARNVTDMGLFRYLLRSARGVFLLAIAASVLSGGSGAAFIAVVNQSLGHAGNAPTALIWAYAALCLTTIVSRFVSQTMLFRLAQGAVFRLRRSLIDGILSAPLRSVEQTGTPRLYSALSDDVVVIADALPGLPALCSSAAFVMVALVYLAIVSPVAAIAALAATVLGVIVYRLFSVYGLRSLGSAREEQDRLFEHFRATTEGIKELKLNRRRRAVLAGQELDATAASYRRHSVTGLSVFEGRRRRRPGRVLPPHRDDAVRPARVLRDHEGDACVQRPRRPVRGVQPPGRPGPAAAAGPGHGGAAQDPGAARVS